ncbi:MAG: hypothetical protein HOV68_25175 [Streptomycetaceae bacterium]|nr:hypothetical protein [Streptomycetaceae bacterium]
MGEQDGAHGRRMRRMAVQIEGLEAFEKDIQYIIDDLLKSPNKLEDRATKDVKPGAYGQNFMEATVVQDATDRVADRVKDLAVKLHLQIEAMRLTVKMSASKAAAADEDNRAALAKILAQYQQTSAPPAGTPQTATPPAVGAQGTGTVG